MDVLLQRLGRLHRHQRERLAGFEQAKAIVLVPEERDLTLKIHKGGEARGRHGLGTVYDDLLIIEATWRALECHPLLEIPAMNRELVGTQPSSRDLASHRRRKLQLDSTPRACSRKRPPFRSSKRTTDE